MKKFCLRALLAILLCSATALPQALPPTTVPQRKPTLRRDRTLSVLLPKILQWEDERVITQELIDMVSPISGHNGNVRKRAILALGRIGYPRGLTVLVEAMKADRNEEMRALAAFALGEIESHYAVAALLDRLDVETEKSRLVHARAAEALGKIATNKLSAETLGNYAVRGIADTLVKLLPDPAKPVSAEEKLVGSLALTALLRLRFVGTVPAVADQLRSPDADLRWQAANALARIREGLGATVPALLPALADKEPLVRAYAARALGVAKDTRAIEPLVKLLADADERVVAGAVAALSAIGDVKAVPPLLDAGGKLLDGYRAADRERLGPPPQQNLLLLIASALGSLKDARALPFLKAFRLADNRVGQHPEIEIAVARFGEAAFFDFPETAKPSPAQWKTIASFAQGLGQLKSEKAKPALLELLAAKPDDRAISDILNAMEANKVEGLQKILFEQLKSPDYVVRAAAATILGNAGDSSEAVVNALTDAYKAARNDRMNDARIAVIEALNKLKRPINVFVLADETKDEDYVVRRKAAELLLESKQEVGTMKLSIGPVKTNHNREYWRRVAQLALSRANPIAVLYTKKGEIRLELLVSEAPMTADSFIQLAKSGYFNGTSFMRVVPNFVIQGGDPRDDQNGGPGFQIRDEINLKPYAAGTVGMALSGKDTGGSQFFITHSPQPHLDGGYTVFGQVVSGMEVVARIARGDRVERVEIIDAKP